MKSYINRSSRVAIATSIVLVCLGLTVALSVGADQSEEPWVDIEIDPGRLNVPSTLTLTFGRSTAADDVLLITSLNLGGEPVRKLMNALDVVGPETDLAYMMGQWFVSRKAGGDFWVGLLLRKGQFRGTMSFRLPSIFLQSEQHYPRELAFRLVSTSEDIEKFLGHSAHVQPSNLRALTFVVPVWARVKEDIVGWAQIDSKRWKATIPPGLTNIPTLLLLENQNLLEKWFQEVMVKFLATLLFALVTSVVFVAFVVNQDILTHGKVRVLFIVTAVCLTTVLLFSFQEGVAIAFGGAPLLAVVLVLFFVAILPKKSIPHLVAFLRSLKETTP